MNAFTFDFFSDNNMIHGLFVDRPAHVSYGEIADELYNTYRSDLTVANLVIIRPPVDQPLPSAAVARHDLLPMLERLPHLPVHLLGSVAFKHKLTPNQNRRVAPALKATDVPALISSLRQYELEHYAIDARAVLRTSGPRLFRAPSGKFCRTFLRVGNVQTNRGAIDGFFFWLLPWLKDCRAIVTETWTISSIALNTARLLTRYSPTTHAKVEVDMLSQYHDRSSALIPDTKTVLRRANAVPEGDVLVLVSSSMSGTLVESLKSTIIQIGLPGQRFRFGALYQLGTSSDVEHLCDVSGGINGGTFEFFDEPPPDAGESPAIIEIDRRTYFPLRIEFSQVELRKLNAQRASDFVGAYRNTGLLSCHRDSFLSNGQRHRHHAIYTDVRCIIMHPRFQAKLKACLKEFTVCPVAIVCPPHAAGTALVAVVRKLLFDRFHKDIPAFEHLDLDFHADVPTDRALLRILKRAGKKASMVVVDDVSVTGRRLSRFQQSLRQIDFAGRIHYLVGIARPEKKDDWEKRVRRLRFRSPLTSLQHTVGHAELFVLPDWDADECPWCQEQEFIRQLASGQRPSAAIVERGFRLQAAVRQVPLVDDVFFTPSGSPELRLTRNSILTGSPATQADVFCAVASAIQEMRTDPNAAQTLVSFFPELHVLDHACYLGAHFNESVIRAAVLRAAKTRELEYPSAEQERDRRQAVVDVLKDAKPDVHNLAFEIGVAMAFHKLPSITPDTDIRDILRTRRWEQVFADFAAAAKHRFIG
jgi:hypothetical protein